MFEANIIPENISITIDVSTLQPSSSIHQFQSPGCSMH